MEDYWGPFSKSFSASSYGDILFLTVFNSSVFNLLLFFCFQNILFDNSEIILKKNKKAREELRKIGRHKFSTYNESVVNQIKIKTIYVINNNTMEKFGSQYQAAKKLFKNVLEVTSDRMGEIVSK